VKPVQDGRFEHSESSRARAFHTCDDTGLLYGGEKRFVRFPGVAAACLRARRTDASFGQVMGDSLLMDFCHSFFAVADGSARSCGTSRTLLVSFAEMIARIADDVPLDGLSSEQVSDLVQKVDEESERILRTVSVSESATFTGILILRTTLGLNGIVLHSGDSLLFRISPDTGVVQLSKTNFWMIGRSSRLYQIEETEIPQDTLIVLATDGIADLKFRNTAARDWHLTKLARETPIEEVPDQLLVEHDRSHFPVDDLGMIVFNPARLPHSGERVILSGIS